jgi:hypothetical protein
MSEDTLPEKKYPGEGDWVLVWGQILRGPTHPEDVRVEFFSHNEQYHCDVRTDRVRTVDEQPDFITTCTAMFRFAGGVNGLFVRCVRHERHGGKHRDGGGTLYDESQVIGYIEEKL